MAHRDTTWLRHCHTQALYCGLMAQPISLNSLAYITPEAYVHLPETPTKFFCSIEACANNMDPSNILAVVVFADKCLR